MRKLLQLGFRSQALRNAGWLLAEKGLLLGGGFIFTIALTRYWRVDELGHFQYLLALVALLLPFSNLGLNSLVSHQLVTRPDNIDTIMGTALILRLTGALVGAMIFFCLSFWLVPSPYQSLFWILLLGQISQSLGVFDYYFEAQIHSKISAIVRSSVGLIFMLIKLVYVFDGGDLTGVVWLTAIEWILLGGLWLTVYSMYAKAVTKLSWCRLQAKIYLQRCGWLFLSSMAAIIYLKIDQVMLGMMASSESVAFYSLASRLSEVWYLIPGILVASFYPGLILARQRGEQYQVKLQRLCDALCWGAITIAVLVSLLAPYFVPLIFGEAYQAVTPILQIHIWAGVFIFMRALFSKWLLIEDIPHYSLLTHGSGALINIILNALFIPLWGTLGAAWATMISYAIASYFALFLFSKTRGMAKLMSLAFIAPVRKFVYLARS